ncbi:MAG: PQQ-binding-like beta-propeller repeat protein [Candidatus Bipolaricaulota bacterium]|nr:PQQ-binding-like beta-propeller repeat protein [Candidatus Bipolaricaulota bacterium]
MGWCRPVILLPPWLVRRLSEEELALVLLHELGHVRRRDDWLGLGQEVLRALFFFQPAVWFFGRELAAARELACDAWAAARAGGEGPYLRALVRAGEVLWRWAPVQAVRLGLSGAGLRRRVQMLRSGKWREPRRKGGWRLGLAALSLGVVLGLLYLPPVVFLGGRAAEGGMGWRQVPGRPTEPGTFAVLSGQASLPLALAFSPRGDLLAVAEYASHVVRLWDLASGREALTLVPPPRTPPRLLVYSVMDSQGLAFSPDGRRLATFAPVGEEAYLCLWDLERQALLVALPVRVWPLQARFSPDGRLLAWVGSPPFVHVPPEQRMGVEWLNLENYERGLLATGDTALEFSPEGKWLAVAQRKPHPEVALWDVATWTKVRAWPYSAAGLAFSPDGQYLALAGEDGVTVLHLPTDTVQARLPVPTKGPLAFSPEGFLLVWHPAGRVQAWSPVGALLWDFSTPTGRTLAFHPTGQLLALANWDPTVTVWDVPAQKPRFVLPGFPAGGPLASAAGRVALAAGAEVTVWDEPYAGPGFRAAHRGSVTGLAFDAAGRRLAVGVSGFPAYVALWDLATGTMLEFPMAMAAVTAVALAADGSTLAAADEQKQIWVWDMATGGLRYTFAMPERAARSLAFSPDGRKLAAASWALSQDETTLVVWDLATGTKAWERGGYAGWVAFRPQGLFTLFLGARGGGLALLDPQTGKELRRYSERGYLWGLALDHTGRYLLAFPIEAPVEVWDLEEERLLGRLPVYGFTHVAGGAFGEGGLVFFTGHPLSDRSLGALVAFHLGHLLER